MNELLELWKRTGFADLQWQMVVMWVVVATLLYLAIVKGFEPLLLIPISLGALVSNLPIQEIIMNAPVYDPDGSLLGDGGLFWYLNQGIILQIYPPLIFLGVGALIDFGPLIANPRTLLLGGAAQFGIFATFLAAPAARLRPQGIRLHRHHRRRRRPHLHLHRQQTRARTCSAPSPWPPTATWPSCR